MNHARWGAWGVIAGAFSRCLLVVPSRYTNPPARSKTLEHQQIYSGTCRNDRSVFTRAIVEQRGVVSRSQSQVKLGCWIAVIRFLAVLEIQQL
jgi:hypothetical protein